ncbi:hypothetical protein HN682_05120 [Candidatus Peregrinibacteria bacterium]|nr:hypothetical protein [Candidatus Peregrinibacteria bacterium]
MPFVATFSGLSMPNSTAVISNCAPSDKQGEILGTSQSLQAAGMALPPLIAGFLSILDTRLPIITAGGLILIAWLIFVTMFKSPKNDVV